MAKTKINNLLTTLIITTAILFPLSGAFADSVNPAVIDFSAKGGEMLQKSFNYSNDSDHDKTIILDIRPYVVKGGIAVFADENGNPITSAMKGWITFNKSQLSIPKGENADI